MAAPNFVPISFSSLTKWESCPRLWYNTSVIKRKDSGSKATYAGQEEHAKLAAAVEKGEPAPCPWSQKIIDLLKGSPGRVDVEKWLSVTRDMKHAPYGTTPWLRAQVDLMYTSEGATKATIIDWKTGKFVPTERDVDQTQLRLTSLMMFGLKPNMERITVGLAYTQGRKLYKLNITRDEVEESTRSPEIKKLYERIAIHEAGQSATDHKAIPNRGCTYCPDAECKYNPGYQY
jgi:PD-(D/E)XK nuclease superfamily